MFLARFIERALLLAAIVVIMRLSEASSSDELSTETNHSIPSKNLPQSAFHRRMMALDDDSDDLLSQKKKKKKKKKKPVLIPTPAPTFTAITPSPSVPNPTVSIIIPAPATFRPVTSPPVSISPVTNPPALLGATPVPTGTENGAPASSPSSIGITNPSSPATNSGSMMANLENSMENNDSKSSGGLIIVISLIGAVGIVIGSVFIFRKKTSFNSDNGKSNQDSYDNGLESFTISNIGNEGGLSAVGFGKSNSKSRISAQNPSQISGVLSIPSDIFLSNTSSTTSSSYSFEPSITEGNESMEEVSSGFNTSVTSAPKTIMETPKENSEFGNSITSRDLSRSTFRSVTSSGTSGSGESAQSSSYISSISSDASSAAISFFSSEGSLSTVSSSGSSDGIYL